MLASFLTEYGLMGRSVLLPRGHRDLDSDVQRYNDEGTVRPVFYRLSLAEMVVPYGAPEYPHPRKFAFDA